MWLTACGEGEPPRGVGLECGSLLMIEVQGSGENVGGICSSEDRYSAPIIVLRFVASSESPLQVVTLVAPTGTVVQVVPSL